MRTGHIRGVQERPTGRSEEHSCESAAPATADDYQLRRLRVFAQDSGPDGHARRLFRRRRPGTRSVNPANCSGRRTTSSPVWMLLHSGSSGGGAQRGLHTHVAPHVDGNQGGAPRRRPARKRARLPRCCFRIHRHRRRRGPRSAVDRRASRPRTTATGDSPCETTVDRRRTDDQSGEFAVPARAERNDVRALGQFDQAIGDAAVE